MRSKFQTELKWHSRNIALIKSCSEILFYFILSSEIMENISAIIVVSIYSEMIWYHFTVDWYHHSMRELPFSIILGIAAFRKDFACIILVWHYTTDGQLDWRAKAGATKMNCQNKSANGEILILEYILFYYHLHFTFHLLTYYIFIVYNFRFCCSFIILSFYLSL